MPEEEEDPDERARADTACDDAFWVTGNMGEYVMRRDIAAVAVAYGVDEARIVMCMLRSGARPELKGWTRDGGPKYGPRMFGVALAPRSMWTRVKGISMGRWGEAALTRVRTDG